MLKDGESESISLGRLGRRQNFKIKVYCSDVDVLFKVRPIMQQAIY